ncbi:MAG TPA: FAD-dependent oxidoreductase [Chloroflexota bacterium]|nr:FAD-dependent oxidoreductase [Chloroflexota bacterium]
MNMPLAQAATVPLAREVPVAREADVLVIGGGPAGIGAAVGAARAGARTVLVERYGFLGGNATASLVGPFMTSFSNDGSRQIIGGVFDELVRRMEEVGGAIHPERVRAGSAEAGYYRFGHDHVTPFDPEVLKVLAADMVLDAGCSLVLHTSFVDPILEDRAVRGAFVHNKGGLQAIAADIVVDCSADADVAFRAGAPTQKGREADGKMQPMTMFFVIEEVDDAAVDAHIRAHPEEEGMLFHGIVEAAKARGAFPIPRDKIGIYRTPEPGVWRVNTTRLLGLDGTNPDDLTRAEIDGRKQVFALLEFMRRECPGLATVKLREIAAQIGVRETRRIVGEYVLTAEDLATGRHFEDVIALAGYPVDIHPVDGAAGGVQAALEAGLRTADVYEIPYRSLVPLQIEDLLVAGRCLSATHEAAGAVRVMPPCFAMGQAAGVAAAIAAEQRVAPRTLDPTRIQSILRRQGAILE